MKWDFSKRFEKERIEKNINQAAQRKPLAQRNTSSGGC